LQGVHLNAVLEQVTVVDGICQVSTDYTSDVVHLLLPSSWYHRSIPESSSVLVIIEQITGHSSERVEALSTVGVVRTQFGSCVKVCDIELVP